MTEASALSPEYVDLVPGLRQTMGLFTTGMQTQNNASDIKIFMLHLYFQLNSITSRVNPGNTSTHAALPAFLYINASIVPHLLGLLLTYLLAPTGQSRTSAPLGWVLE